MMMMKTWDDEEAVLKSVFRYLDRNPGDLGRCMLVCKRWQNILTKDGYVWRCLIARQWPSVSTSRHMTTSLLKRIYGSFDKAKEYHGQHYRYKWWSYTDYKLYDPKSEVSDYKFYLDIWNGDDGSLILSKVIQASSFLRSIPSPPGVSDPLVAVHLESSDYKLMAHVQPRITIPRPKSVNVSLLVGRQGHDDDDDDERACIIHKSTTHAVLPGASFAVALDDLGFCPGKIIVPRVQAWLCMYFTTDDDIRDEEDEDCVDLYGIELGFSDVLVHNFEPKPLEIKYAMYRKYDWYKYAIGVVRDLEEETFLCLLEILDWKNHKVQVNSSWRENIGEFERASCEELVNLVFPFLEGNDLAKCMSVCKQWRDIGEDEYFWKNLCAKGWPSVYNQQVMNKNTITSYRRMFGRYYTKPPHLFELPLPVLDFSDIEVFIDIFQDSYDDQGRHVYSKAVNGADLLVGGIDTSAPGICDAARAHLESSEFKMTIPIEPGFSMYETLINLSLLVLRKDTNQVALLISPHKIINLADRDERRIFGFDYTGFSADYQLIPYIKLFVSLLYKNLEEEDDSGRICGKKVVDVYGAELAFVDGGDAYDTKERVLWLLHMLDWK